MQSYKDIVKEYEYLYQDKIQTAGYVDDYFPVVKKDVAEYYKEKKETVRVVIDDDESDVNAGQDNMTGEEKKVPKRELFDDAEWVVVSALSEHGALTLEDIVDNSHDPLEKIIAALTMLEIKGDVERDGNGRYRLCL